MKILKLVALSFLSAFIPLDAREGTQQDFSFIVENSAIEISINKDGSYVTTGTETFKVLKEEAKQFFSPYKLSFDPSEEDTTIVEAFVINNGEKVEVDKNNIQKSYSAAKKGGIVNLSEIAIPFSQVKPGSIISYKMKSEHKAGVFADYFSFKNNYGDQIPENQDIVKITSPKELFYIKNDPAKVLEVKTSKDSKGNFVLESSLLKPHLHIAINELGKISSEETTSLKVTNVNNWEKLGKVINDKFIAVQMQDTLPSALQEVIKKIPKDAALENKINSVLIYITSNYDYLGDWRGHGKVVPKKIEKIVADRFGDCKDFSTLLIKMLRAMNIKADYALVQRSFVPNSIDKDSVPLLDYFNHMIARVENSGKIFWIDPTNRYSVGLEARADISGRAALVLNNKGAALEYIPELDPAKQIITNAKLYQFDSDNSATVDLICKIEGESAKLTLDVLKDKNNAQIQDILTKELIKEKKHAVINFDLENKKENAYYNLNIRTKYKADEIGTKGKGDLNGKIELPKIEFLHLFSLLGHDGIGNTDIKLLPKIENAVFYKNIFLAGQFPNTCNITTNWINATRKIDTRPDGFIVKDLIELKKKILTKENYANSNFINLVAHLNECFNNSFAEYTYAIKKHTDNFSTFEDELKKLSPEVKLARRIKRSLEIFDSRGEAKIKNEMSLENARLLMEKNLLERPNDPESLMALSEYYSNNAYIVGDSYIDSELKHSLDIIDRAIAADPTNSNALIDKANILYKMKDQATSKDLLLKSISGIDPSKTKYSTLKKIISASLRLNEQDIALKYFDLALSKAPDDKEKAILYSYRASYFLDMNQYLKCIDDYENSLKLNAQVAWNYGNVAICYNHLEQYDQAIDRAKKAISIMNYGAAHYVLADSYLGKGKKFFNQLKDKECEENFQLALMEFPRADIYIELYRLYLSKDELEKAQEISKKALLAIDEHYTLDWIQRTLDFYKAEYEKSSAIKRKIAQVRENIKKRNLKQPK